MFPRNIAIYKCSMGITKSQLFSENINELAAMAKVLGHPARIAILEYLVRANSCINGNLVDELGLAQSTISQHLRELKELGIIQGEVEGTSMCYCINKEVWEDIKSSFINFFDSYDPISNCC